MVRHGRMKRLTFSCCDSCCRKGRTKGVPGLPWGLVVENPGSMLAEAGDEDLDGGQSQEHSFVLLFNGVVGQCWSRSGLPPELLPFSLPWLSPLDQCRHPPFSAHNLNFARRSGPMRNGCPAHFQCSPERTGAPSPTMHAPLSRTCSPPQSMATNENGGCPRMGPISGQTSLDRQA